MAGDILGVLLLLLAIVGGVSLCRALCACVDLAALRERNRFDD